MSIFLFAGIWYFLFDKAKKAIKERDGAKRDKEYLEGDIINLNSKKEELQNEVNKNNENIIRIKEKEKEINEEFAERQKDYDKKIRKLKDRLDKKESIANEKIEEQIKIETRKRKEELDHITRLKQQNLNELKQEQKEVREKRDKIGLYETEINQIKKRKELALEKYGERYGKDNLFINNGGYLQFKRSKNDPSKEGEELHRYLYRKNFSIGINQEVHHIDGNRLNCELWNLIALDREKHDSVNHAKIIMGNWKGGLKVLMEILNLEEENLPEHIKNHINELKEQKRLG
jgi:hypothetical protein